MSNLAETPAPCCDNECGCCDPEPPVVERLLYDIPLDTNFTPDECSELVELAPRIVRYIHDHHTNRRIGLFLAFLPKGSDTVYITCSYCNKIDRKEFTRKNGIYWAVRRLMNQCSGDFSQKVSIFENDKTGFYNYQLDRFLNGQVFRYFKKPAWLRFHVCKEIEDVFLIRKISGNTVSGHIGTAFHAE